MAASFGCDSRRSFCSCVAYLESGRSSASASSTTIVRTPPTVARCSFFSPFSPSSRSSIAGGPTTTGAEGRRSGGAPGAPAASPSLARSARRSRGGAC